ncbi:hypothetical protein J1C56_04630 [Aminobacter anthyllidis]|uniref:Uncharacterized protein n=1 Tax=Aminobacter anthyllidis TaxID=1035067 RepID=A0A9X1A7Y3_9HYPH|nr:hypothetical protein [Aminobacter anthyllidis]MBT1154872.1 hypothetical protein [Aminobacter anthyllidis]
MLWPFFAIAKASAKAYPAGNSGKQMADPPLADRTTRISRHIMDDSVQKSCWGLTAKAVIGFAGFLLIAWLVSGAETAAVVAAG